MSNSNKYQFTKNEKPDYKLNSNGSDDKTCNIKFSMCDDKYPMYKLKQDELKEFVKFAKKVENTEWKKIKKDRGLRYETLNGMNKPDNISRDIIMKSMRLSKKFRILGYRQDEFFYIVWFDNNHETC